MGKSGKRKIGDRVQRFNLPLYQYLVDGFCGLDRMILVVNYRGINIGFWMYHWIGL
jgi:hypothetical protein